MSLNSTVIDTGLVSARRVVSRLGSGEAGSHAILLYGPLGSGKVQLAKDLAKAWMCKNPGSAPCGECQPCRAFERGNAVDLLHIKPEGASRWIRLKHIVPDPKPEGEPAVSVQEFFRTSPLVSRNKVVLIEDLDRLYPGADNAFLKTLEEPPDFAKIVCLTAVIGSVLPTLVSRCLCIRCDLPERLESHDLEPELLALAHGAPGVLEKIVANREWYVSWLEFARKLLSASLRDSLRLSDDLRALMDRGSEQSVRQKQADGLEILGGLFTILGGRPAQTDEIVRAHRFVVGNANASFVLDSMIPRIIGEREGKH